MKNRLFQLIVCVMFAIPTFASYGPDMNLTVLKTDAIEVSFDNLLQRSLFTEANFDNSGNLLEFVTEKEISYIQIYNESNQMEFQLQVGSKKVRLSKNILDKGVYKLGFIVKGQETIEFLGVKVN